ncbi:MAG: cobalamin biosynthesis protein CbiX [Rhodobacteraceae bacterium]|nr:cobalamin biosynthesis protein CbiX [Paracoccaceae bacterium]
MPDAILIAHGAPANPGPQEARMRALSAEVGLLMPGWRLRGATLAANGALAAALRGLDAPLIYPFFMSEGWFTGTALPRALARLGARYRQLPPFGTDPVLDQLVESSALSAGIEPLSTTLLLAAHGSQVSPASRLGAEAIAARLRPRFFDVRLGLIEEPPLLADAARIAGPVLCLPFFALRASHVESDIPAALASANFTGPILPPIGEHPCVPALIAAALARA